MKSLMDELQAARAEAMTLQAENVALRAELAAANNKIQQLVEAALDTEATLDTLTKDSLNTDATIEEIQESIDLLTVDALGGDDVVQAD